MLKDALHVIGHVVMIFLLLLNYCSNLRKGGGMDTGQVGFHDTNMLFKAKVNQ